MITKQVCIGTRAFCLTLIVGFLASFPIAGSAAPGGRTYTTNADFDEGVLVGVEHDTVPDQLQLSKENVTLPFIWIPNQNGTVSKLNTLTGQELGRYLTAPGLPNGSNPSRTTVDLQGSCYVGNRVIGTVVKIGLLEAGQCVDRNGDGVIDTSRDLDSDGNINGSEILAWGQDECVLSEIVLIPGIEGTYVPGTFPGAYANDYWNPGPRSFAVDSKNNLWAGCYGSQKFYYINGSTGAIEKTVDVSPYGHTPYGGTIDKYGVVWSASLATHVLWLDPSTDPPTIGTIELPHWAYGIGLDYLDHLFVTGWAYSKLSRINVATKTIDWTQDHAESNSARGIAATSDNDMWEASSFYGTVNRFSNDGTLETSIPVGPTPTGVSVDAAGKVWVCNLGDENVNRIDPATNTVDLTKTIIGSGGHYSYSDMTGIVSRTITTKTGTWTVVYDSGAAATPWGSVCWTGETPAGTSITVKAMSSNDQVTWSAPETAVNCAPLAATPPGQYLKVEATLQISSGEVSPVLYDLTVKPANLPPDTSNATPSSACIWPPNNKFVEESILGVTDPDGNPVSITITGITSDEPTATIQGAGGAQHAPDAFGIETTSAAVRAERSGTGNGRVYQITFIADDGSGTQTPGSVTVCVPHDQADSCVCVDDGQSFNATGIN